MKLRKGWSSSLDPFVGFRVPGPGLRVPFLGFRVSGMKRVGWRGYHKVEEREVVLGAEAQKMPAR